MYIHTHVVYLRLDSRPPRGQPKIASFTSCASNSFRACQTSNQLQFSYCVPTKQNRSNSRSLHNPPKRQGLKGGSKVKALHTVDGCEILHQLMGGKHPTICRESTIQGGAAFRNHPHAKSGCPRMAQATAEGLLFPTCQVRLLRFYVRCPDPPRFLPRVLPSSAPDLICQLLLAVDLAEPHLPALDRSDIRRTSSASS